MGKLHRARQGFVKGNGPAIFDAITNGGILLKNGEYLLNNGMQVGNHLSKTTGDYTIRIKQNSGKVIKIRIIE